MTARISQGRLLDVGTGPGRLLREIHRLNPRIELFGLDISAAMIEVARRNLAGINVDLRAQNIWQTDYDNDYFDIVTCTGSLCLWDNPAAGIEEIFRILKKGRAEIQSINGTTQELWTCGELVYQRGTFGMSVKSKDRKRPDAFYGSFFQVWQKQPDGAFKIKMTIWNLDFNPFGSEE